MNLTRPISGAVPSWVSSHQCFSHFSVQTNHQGHGSRADADAIGPAGCVHLASSLVMLVCQHSVYERFPPCRRAVLLGTGFSFPREEGVKQKVPTVRWLLSWALPAPPVTPSHPRPQAPPTISTRRSTVAGHSVRRARGPKQAFSWKKEEGVNPCSKDRV